MQSELWVLITKRSFSGLFLGSKKKEFFSPLDQWNIEKDSAEWTRVCLGRVCQTLLTLLIDLHSLRWVFRYGLHIYVGSAAYTEIQVYKNRSQLCFKCWVYYRFAILPLWNGLGTQSKFWFL